MNAVTRWTLRLSLDTVIAAVCVATAIEMVRP